MNLITRLIYWLIRFLLSLLIEETGGSGPERVTKGLKAIEDDLQNAAQFAFAQGDKERGRKYSGRIATVWTVGFEVKQLTRARVRLPRIRVVWPVVEKS